MPRKKRSRQILTPPSIKGMSAFGLTGRKNEQISLFFEEYETIKLLDYDNMTQEEAAVHMDVSRPTLTRIYEKARNKVARAMVEGKDLLIRGGHFHFGDDWFRCQSCKANFNILPAMAPVCPLCNTEKIISLNEHYSTGEK